MDQKGLKPDPGQSQALVLGIWLLFYGHWEVRTALSKMNKAIV
jgi:hypothetical protein